MKQIQLTAFNNNPRLRKVILPASLEGIGNNAFSRCDALDTIIAGPKITRFPDDLRLGVYVLLPHGTEDADWLVNRTGKYYEAGKDISGLISRRNTLIRELIEHAYKTGQKEWGENLFSELAGSRIAAGDTVGAMSLVQEAVSMFSPYGYTLSGLIHHICGNMSEEIKCFEKAMKVNPVTAGNMLAYAYALPEYGRRDRKKAMGYIDKALAACDEDNPQRPNLLDSKGEIYLLFGDKDTARQIHDDICRDYPDFFSTANSKLHASFQSAETTTETTAETDASPDKTSSGQPKGVSRVSIQDYLDVVMAIARAEHRKLDIPNIIPSPDYEELLAIGIISVQIIIKDKTPEQLEKYNSAYIAATVKWAIRNELSIRYEWYNITPSGELDNSFYTHKELFETNDYDAMQLKTIIYIYTALRDLYHNLDAKSAAKKEVDEMWKAISSCREFLNDDNARFLDYLTSRDAADHDIFAAYDFNLIVSTIAMLRQSLQSEGRNGYGLVKGQKTTDKPEPETDKEKLRTLMPELADIARKAAAVEERRLRAENVDIDSSNVEGIGMIAVQTLCKGRTPENLEKASPISIYIATDWAIQAELNSIYPKSIKVNKPVKEYSLTDKALLLLDNVKNLYYFCLDTDDHSELGRFAIERCEAISRRIPEMSPEAKLIGSEIMRRDSRLGDILGKYSEESIKTFIDELGSLGRYPKDRPTNE